MNNEMIIVRMKELCIAPKSEGKNEFFSRLEEKGLPCRRPVVMSHGEFLTGQLGYIDKWIWVLSGALLVFIIWCCSQNTGNFPFALTPLLAGGMLIETGRSHRWKMDELEYASRFSLRSIVLARMFLIGLIDTAGLLVVIAVVRSYLTYSLFRVFLYMMVPYLMASFLGSVYERKRRKDAGLGSFAICLLSSGAFAAVPFFAGHLYEKSMTFLWTAAFFLLASSFVVNIRGYLKDMEEPVWN